MDYNKLKLLLIVLTWRMAIANNISYGELLKRNVFIMDGELIVFYTFVKGIEEGALLLRY